MNIAVHWSPWMWVRGWGFRDVNEWLFCAALLYSLGRFHQTKLVGLSKSLIYCFYVEDMMPLFLPLLLTSSKKPEGGHYSVGTTEQCEKLAMQLWVQTPFPLSPWQWPRLYWGLCSSTSICRGIFLGMEQSKYRFWFWSKIHIFSISLLIFFLDPPLSATSYCHLLGWHCSLKTVLIRKFWWKYF